MTSASFSSLIIFSSLTSKGATLESTYILIPSDHFCHSDHFITCHTWWTFFWIEDTYLPVYSETYCFVKTMLESNVCLRRYDILSFMKPPQGRPVAVRILKVEDLASYLRWLLWHGIKSQPSQHSLKMKWNAWGFNIGQAEDEKSQANDKKAR